MFQPQHRGDDRPRLRTSKPHHADPAAPRRRGDGHDRVVKVHAPIVTGTLNGTNAVVKRHPGALLLSRLLREKAGPERSRRVGNLGALTLSVADELLKANETFARNFTLGDLAVRPKRHVAVLACMDSRILFEHCLGLHPGDAHMIRNAGGIATDDALRSLIVSHHLLDTQEFIIINHTDCGLLKVREDELKQRLTEKMGTAVDEPAHFHAFDDLEANVRLQMQRVKSHPWIPKHIPVRGFVYDVKTGKLKEVGSS
jgi:carbonic anhydrase